MQLYPDQVSQTLHCEFPHVECQVQICKQSAAPLAHGLHLEIPVNFCSHFSIPTWTCHSGRIDIDKTKNICRLPLGSPQIWNLHLSLGPPANGHDAIQSVGSVSHDLGTHTPTILEANDQWMTPCHPSGQICASRLWNKTGQTTTIEHLVLLIQCAAGMRIFSLLLSNGTGLYRVFGGMFSHSHMTWEQTRPESYCRGNQFW